MDRLQRMVRASACPRQFPLGSGEAGHRSAAQDHTPRHVAAMRGSRVVRSECDLATCPAQGESADREKLVPVGHAAELNVLAVFANGLSPNHACILLASCRSPVSNNLPLFRAARTVSSPIQMAVIVRRSL